MRTSEERARAQLEQRVPEGIRDKVHLLLPHGSAAEEILRAARERQVDLIVIARHGHSGILERLLGGVAYRVVRQAHCPVLVVR